MGKPGAFADPELLSTVSGVVQKARAAGKHAGILAMPGPLLSAAIEAGANLVFAGSDITNLAAVWKSLLATLQAAPARGSGPR